MKRTTSVVLIAATCFIVLGIVLVSAAIAFARNDGYRVRDEIASARFGFLSRDMPDFYKAPQLREETFEDITRVELGAVNSRISIKRGGDKFELSVEERYKDEYRITSGNGRLSVTAAEKKGLNIGFLDGLFSLQNNYDTMTDMTLTIPEGAELELLSVSAVNGKVETEPLVLGEFRVELVNGKVDAAADAENISFSGVNTVVTLAVPEGTAGDYSIRFSGLNGSLRINDETISGVALGEFERGNGTRGRITMDAVNGSLTVTD